MLLWRIRAVCSSLPGIKSLLDTSSGMFEDHHAGCAGMLNNEGTCWHLKNYCRLAAAL